MRHKRLKLSAVLLLGLGLTGLQAQTMYVKESSGTQTAYALSNIQKMSFSSGNLTVTKTDNNRPQKYMFEGQSGGLYSNRSIQNILKNACHKADITKHTTVHSYNIVLPLTFWKKGQI